ncbi:MAG TPA: hypothetical protein DIT59_00635 [Leclercia sp.]|nr:hypothetical protein [Leclercia sp.]
MPGGAMLAGPTRSNSGFVGRVRRSRHPALRLPGLGTDCSPVSLPQLFNASIATQPSGVCSQRGAFSVSA